jgi:tetratricopeptide (TPR) repeat protein
LCDATIVQSADVPGAPLLTDFDGAEALHGWNVARALILFATKTAPPDLYNAAALEAWETALLFASQENPFLTPLAVIVGELRDWDSEDKSTLCGACHAMAEAALERRAIASALYFMEAAALCWPENARYAMVAGRAFKTYGRLRESERWLRRAIKLSRWFEDWDTHVLSTSSYGMLCWTQGGPARARKYLLRARNVAHRHRLHVLEGEVLHNLLVVAITTEDHAHVADYASGALSRYVPNHPRLAALAYDLAYYWMTRGHAGTALPMFRELLGHFHSDTQKLQVLAASARAAGACNERSMFEESWSEAFATAESAEIGVALPAALIDLGFGAAHIGEWERAGTAFTGALCSAQELGLSEELIRADTCVAAVQQRQNPDTLSRPHSPLRDIDSVSRRFVVALRDLPGYAAI